MSLLGAITRPFVRRVPAPQPGRRTVAIAVPLSLRETLLPEEEISLRHLSHYLGDYDAFFIAPRGSTMRRPGFKVLQVPRLFFGSAAAHNHLLLWPRFYELFAGYEYVLIYHLDSLVLANQLDEWCAAGWDYIGAPWIPSDDTPWVREARVGNGGFTLMKVDRVLEVLHRRHQQDPRTFWADLLMRRTALTPIFRVAERAAGRFPRWSALRGAVEYWRTTQEPGRYGTNNDMFWALEARRYVSDFKVATVEDGLRFAFEAAPRQCYEMNGRRLPFGCHAWTRFDAAFWMPHLLPDQAPSPAVAR